jgi:hypothetical protein
MAENLVEITSYNDGIAKIDTVLKVGLHHVCDHINVENVKKDMAVFFDKDRIKPSKGTYKLFIEKTETTFCLAVKVS